MKRLKQLPGRAYRHFMQDSLYRNSLYLMLSSAITSFAGFIFWIVVAHKYSTSQVGIATALVSVTGLIANVSLLGFDTALIRYLAISKSKDKLINTALLSTASAATLGACVYLLIISRFSNHLDVINNSPIRLTIFIVTICTSTISLILESIFIAYRKSKFVLIKNTLISGLKLVLPWIFLSLGAYGIFTAYGLSIALGVMSGGGILIYVFEHRLNLKFDKQTLKQVYAFSGINYLTNFLMDLPGLFMPLLVATVLGAKPTAYFYLSNTIAVALGMIPAATTQSLFAEGITSQANAKKLFKRGLKMIAIMMIPLVTLLIIFAHYILLVFGGAYATNAIAVFRLLCFSGLLVSLQYTLLVQFKIRHELKNILIVGASGGLTTMLLAIIFLRHGLVALGIIWNTGLLVSCIAGVILERRFQRSNTKLSTT